MNNGKIGAVSSRQLIGKAAHNIFIVIALVSVVIGACAVGSYFLFNEFLFRAKVISEKTNTIKTLDSNIKNISDLDSNISSMLATNSLLSTFAEIRRYDRSPRAAISDALPLVEEDGQLDTSTTMAGISNILTSTRARLTRLSSTPVTGNSSTAGARRGSAPVAPKSGLHPLGVSFRVEGDQRDLAEILDKLGRSIRQVDFKSVKWSIDQQSGQLVLEAEILVYFADRISIELEKKDIRSGGSPATRLPVGGAN